MDVPCSGEKENDAPLEKRNDVPWNIDIEKQNRRTLTKRKWRTLLLKRGEERKGEDDG